MTRKLASRANEDNPTLDPNVWYTSGTATLGIEIRLPLLLPLSGVSHTGQFLFEHLRFRLLTKLTLRSCSLYARIVTSTLKSNRLNDFTEMFEKQVIPMLRKQNGFKDEIALVGPSGTEVRTISLWDKKENAESYNTTTYPEVLKILANVLEGTPQIKTYDVVSSTFHKIPTLATV